MKRDILETERDSLISQLQDWNYLREEGQK